jgi:diadenylate cyclase
MINEKEKFFIDHLKLISPGTPLREVIDNIVRSDLGALIVFEKPEMHKNKMISGGFRINCRFTPQKLFELCKMDGAIVVSQDLKRIIYANVLVTPNQSITTIETGTRHIAAEKISKQANTFCVVVSERKKKTTIYYGNLRYHLRSTDEILRNVNSTLQILEKQREILDTDLNNLNILEMSEMVSAGDVCKVIQRTEIITKLSKSLKRNFTELGKEGNIMHMRYKELIRGIEEIIKSILRDYSVISLKKSRNLLENITFDGILDLESISRLILEKSVDEAMAPKGYRFLSKLTLSEKEIYDIVNECSNLNFIMKIDNSEKIENILGNRALKIKQEIENLREQILSGKVVC